MRSTSGVHSDFFFSSLRQAEKRLKLEANSEQNRKQEQHSIDPTPSLSTPIYIHQAQSHPSAAAAADDSSANLQESSEPPSAFLSSPPNSSPPHENPPRESPRIDDGGGVLSGGADDIEVLMQVLGLSDSGNNVRVMDGDESRIRRDGFYKKNLGVKSEEEVERLDGWIDWYLGDGAKEGHKEPFRLALLLLGKAALNSENGLEFPSAIDDYLKVDPPQKD